MAKIVISLGEKSWDFDDKAVSLRDAYAVKAATGLAVKPWLEGIQEMDPHALAALIWFVRRPSEPQLRVEDIDFVLSDLRVENAPDPTPEVETTSVSDETATSTSSAAG